MIVGVVYTLQSLCFSARSRCMHGLHGSICCLKITQFFQAVTYTDVHVELPGPDAGRPAYCSQARCSLRTAAYGAPACDGSRPPLCRVCWLYVAVQMAGAAVSTFVVKPNELVKEQPYIRNNITATRAAFALDSIVVRPFAARNNSRRYGRSK